jgi:phytoene dehydrogenase-like protein
VPGLLRFARFALLPVRRLADEEFRGAGAAALLAGCALHTDLSPESTGSTAYGWLLAMLGQQVGFPVPRGGAGELTAALVRRLESRGGSVLCGDAVRRVEVRGGRAVGVVTASGTAVPAGRAVLADVAAVQLYGGLVGWEHLPAGLRGDLRRFDWDYATVKVDWALRAPLPWTAPGAGTAGTVHVAAGLDEMTRYCTDLTLGRLPERPFLLVGQMTTSDPSRSPAGTESLWAYTHVPQREWGAGELDRFVEVMESQLERFAPGWRELVMARWVSGPGDLESHDANLVGGAINGGTAAVHQQLVFRPTAGLGRPETPVAGLYLASSSAHPGGGVHGACGANAARAALRAARLGTQRLGSWAARAAMGN